MKQPDGKKKPKRPGRKKPDVGPDNPVVSYTPEQRRMIRNGLGIWARVAIRSYLRQREGELQAETEPIKEDEV